MKRFLINFVKILFFFLGWAILSGMIEVPSSDPAVWRFWAELIPLAVIIIFSVVFLRIEKGQVIIPIKRNAARGIVVGVVTGAVWIGASAAILFASKQLCITGKNEISQMWLWCISAFINVVMQELLVRGYIYQLLKKEYNLLTAVIISTMLFTLMHGGAFEAGILSVINVITMCLFTTALYEAEGTLLAPIMAHAVWNIVGAIILGGVSLAEDYPNWLHVSASANAILSGGATKMEGSIVVTIINILLTLIFFFRYRKRATGNVLSK